MGRATFWSVGEARRLARRRLPRVVFDFVDGGADDELTLRVNRLAYGDLAFRPRVGVGVGAPELTRTVLGKTVALPVLLAPCGFAWIVHPDGESGVARAAESAGTISILSTASGTSLEEVASAARGPLWFQLYFLGGRRGAEALVDRAARAGYSALVLTLDSAVGGNRERDKSHGVVEPLRADVRNIVRFGPMMARHPGWLAGFARDGFPLELANLAGLSPDIADIATSMAHQLLDDEPPTWGDLEWIRSQWAGPVVVKGVLTADDARRAIDRGADAIVVSNHGGRQLDGTPATIRVLPEVVAAAGRSVEVLLDGGVRRGTDVVKALALGARAVLVGRAYLYGLAVGGQAGVAKVLEILRSEIERALVLLGTPSVKEIDRSSLF